MWCSGQVLALSTPRTGFDPTQGNNQKQNKQKNTIKQIEGNIFIKRMIATGPVTIWQPNTNHNITDYIPYAVHYILMSYFFYTWKFELLFPFISLPLKIFK